jgi:hypothetical protein
LHANPCVLQRTHCGKRLRKQPRLDLPGNFQFLRNSPLQFQLLRIRAPLGFDSLVHLIETHKRK